ncbi:2-hydroxyacyl-CoA dehydratase family protein [Salinibacterium sp. SYSU T00001]|uniref:2-hydroxyacyl-CoA dehydratase family protein n=1 Tax=Homoserinimonas sedimenticola TaxID=2986805 RepID=UPI0022360A90|nr:2-hydroxyacyl-CoA dehydratase family protein [Salinibacterium sedimenticola]MCW4384631.1 2-hydroxyacyl-CoA dehydratase family protein [Salinibacterium sedimenticola]
MNKHRADRLTAAGDALAYQKRWFAELHEHVAAGGRFALVNADTPHEILRAFDIPYVVNQWWSSIAASRSGAQRYLDLVAQEGLPRDSEQYNAIGLGSVFDPEPATGPWGGLPKPFLVMSDITGDVTRKVFDVWGEQEGITCFEFENSAEAEMEAEWWDDLPHDWERLAGSDRIDLLVAEMQELIAFLEKETGTAFDRDKLARIMKLGNEQAEWNRRTRDLLAQARPCPVSVNDSISAVMVPQWHRGSEWGRDAAKQLYLEVESRIAAGSALATPERARLMWVGRGLWFDLGFYRHFEQEYGAVFVWSMYLAIAADGYLRYGDDPLRALAARFVGFSEHLYVAPMSAEWYVHQARQHGVDGVVHLVSDDPRGNWATTRALEAAGIPVIEVHADNADESSYDVEVFRGRVATWLTESVLSSANVEQP